MAFDGPTPFDGDPAFDYLGELDGSPRAVKVTLRDSFEFLQSGDDYYEVDETVWAWACAELVAFAAGAPSDPPPPEAFATPAEGVDTLDLVPAALAALEVVADETRSEVAQLWAESGDESLEDHLAGLRGRLNSL